MRRSRARVDAKEIDRATRFFRSIGLSVRISMEVPSYTVLPGVWVDRGILVFHPGLLESASDLYHEAGHIAITPAEFRKHMPRAMCFGSDMPPEFLDRVESYLNKIENQVSLIGRMKSMDPTYRNLLQMGEPETIAWSYAAMVAAGCDLDAYWQASEASFGGDAVNILRALQLGAHPGIAGLQASGMTTKQSFPLMIRWLQV